MPPLLPWLSFYQSRTSGQTVRVFSQNKLLSPFSGLKEHAAGVCGGDELSSSHLPAQQCCLGRDPVPNLGGAAAAGGGALPCTPGGSAPPRMGWGRRWGAAPALSPMSCPVPRVPGGVSHGLILAGARPLLGCLHAGMRLWCLGRGRRNM